MDLCTGMCTGKLFSQYYLALMGRITKLIDGTDLTILEEMEQKMNIALIEFLDNKEIKLFLTRYNKLIFSERYKLNDFNIDEIKCKIKSNIISSFRSVLKEVINIGKDEIDEVHIIYNYLKSKESTCKYISIKEQWINDIDSLSIDKAVNKLF